MTNTRISWPLILICFIVSLFATYSSCLADSNGDREILIQIARGNRANLLNIQSWQGNATIEITTTNDGKNSSYKAEAKFLFDQTQDALRWEWRKISAEKIYSPTQSSSVIKGLMKRDRIYRMPEVPIDNRPEQITMKIEARPDNRRLAIEGWGDEFNPMAYVRQSGKDTNTFLHWYYDNWNDSRIGKISITRDGDLVQLEIRTDFTVNQHVFDMSKGCSEIRYYAKDDMVEEKEEYQFININGVFIPNYATYQNTASTSGKTKTLSVRTSFANQRINEKINTDEFTIGRIGLLPGDFVVDTVMGINYSYGVVSDAKNNSATNSSSTSKLSDAAKAVDDKPTATGPDNPKSMYNIKNIIWVLIIIILLASGIGCFFLFKKTRNKSSSSR